MTHLAESAGENNAPDALDELDVGEDILAGHATTARATLEELLIAEEAALEAVDEACVEHAEESFVGFFTDVAIIIILLLYIAVDPHLVEMSRAL